MSIKALNSWFNNLDSKELAFLFPFEYEEAMMSCDPDEDINSFYKEVKQTWKVMTKEEKIKLYNELKEA
jgi:hypothetical protein